MIGCGTNSGGVTKDSQTITKYDEDVRAFTKIGTSLILQKANLDCTKLADIREYVMVAQGLIASPKPDYTGARALAVAKLPEPTRPVAMLILDLIERYVPTPKVSGDVAAYQRLAQTAVESVLAAIDECQAMQ
jgi:hypothetical protein